MAGSSMLTTMPQFFSIAGYGTEDALQEMDHALPHKSPRDSSILRTFGDFLKRPEHHKLAQPQTAHIEPSEADVHVLRRRRSLPEQHNLSSKKFVETFPRTLPRRGSEQCDKLLEVPPSSPEKRALSAERRRSRGLSASSFPRRPSSPLPIPIPLKSAPDIKTSGFDHPYIPFDEPNGPPKPARQFPAVLTPLQIPDQSDYAAEVDGADEEHAIDRASLEEEYDRRWILNLSMHFRDKSNREKFFVTYAETPSTWRRISVSLDYRNPPEGSLEADLSTLHYQRDKSFKIYEAIRESLPDIQYYNTVTNLKLETNPEDGQLHVHVREDENEIVQYPAVSLFQHIQVRMYPESELDFQSHLSGFVYKVQVNDRTVIKKEIPGPDTIDEFLYEVNALDALLGCENVVQLEGLVTDNAGLVVKGLLIAYAPQGSLVDMLYDFRDSPQLPWHRREKWAKQIVQGLSDIHEAGFVQGDFTLSNIVIDNDDNAKIIDINRRGCPVGWEPPELGKLIDSGQRVSMCIGVKTDLYQLGMVLWALAEVDDEPERAEQPLRPVSCNIPSYFHRMVEVCLSDRPQRRVPAKRLLRSFPPSAGRPPATTRPSVEFIARLKLSEDTLSSHRSDKEYIDPKMAMTLEEVRRPRTNSGTADFASSGQVTYVEPDSNAASTRYDFESSGSWVVGKSRWRSRGSSRPRRSSPYDRSISSVTSLSSQQDFAPRGRRRHGREYGVDACAMSPLELEDASELTISTAHPPGFGVVGTQVLREEDEQLDKLGTAEEHDAMPPPITDLRLAPGWAGLSLTDSDFVEHVADKVNLDETVPQRQVMSESDECSLVHRSALVEDSGPAEGEAVQASEVRMEMPDHDTYET